MSESFWIGIDIGSVAVKGALIDEAGILRKNIYRRSHGRSLDVARSTLIELIDSAPSGSIGGVGMTGSGAPDLARALGALFVNEIIAQARSAIERYPHINTLIEMGGADSKLLRFKRGKDGSISLGDFSMNDMCAAGTGSFLDQQAARMGYEIAEEFGSMALKARRAPRIAGRCSVFAKSDMIHLQQVGTPDYEIIAGLCHALARSYISNVGRGKEFITPIGFVGGVASNSGVVKALREELGLNEADLFIPAESAISGAIGAASLARSSAKSFKFGAIENIIDALDRHVETEADVSRARASLARLDDRFNDQFHRTSIRAIADQDGPIPCYIGIDIGSLSTNVVAIDSDGELIARRYLRTKSRPIEAVTIGLKEIGDELDGKVIPLGVGTTGSGRYMIGDLVGADIVRNEITAQATAAVWFHPEVDTIFEIGGQDSKYISLENGAVVDFEMNKVCAAGTGSFIEERAGKFDLSIEHDFARSAFDARAPGKFGDRCAVFIESDLLASQQKGMSKEDLTAGLSYSIVTNYLNRVVGSRKIGSNILFQGGVAWNKAIVAAFEAKLGVKIKTPPHHDVTGAIGAALIAKRAREKSENPQPSRFVGFDLSERKYKVTTFECKACDNVCSVSRAKFENDTHIYGARCDLFDSKASARQIDASGEGVDIPDLFSEREKYLFGDYLTKKNFSRPARTNGVAAPIRIGLPRALYFYEHFPFWSTYLEELGFEVVLSGKTNKNLIKEAIETVKAETCFPIKIVYGHIVDLLGKEVDYIFFPSTITANSGQTKFQTSQTCPLAQSAPYMVKGAIEARYLIPPVYFQSADRELANSLAEWMRSEFTHLGRGALKRAYNKARAAQDRFHERARRRGREVIAETIKRGSRPVVLISRSYNGCDSGLNLDLPRKLRAMGKVAAPLDFIELDEDTIAADNPDMYWRSGQKMIAAAEFIRSNEMIDGVMISSFKCGPDSFIEYHVHDRLKGKPVLALEIDEHSADAGAVTRLEAYFDSMDNLATVKFAASAGKESTDDRPAEMMECGAEPIERGCAPTEEAVHAGCCGGFSHSSGARESEMVSSVGAASNGSNGAHSRAGGGACSCGSKTSASGGVASVGSNGAAKPVRLVDRKIYIPYMCDHAYVLSAAFRHVGIDAQTLPESDYQSLDIGLKFASGKECVPFTLTTGDIVKKSQEEGFDKDRSAFFMPTTNGPCRFGQYQSAQRLFLRDLGMESTPLISPDSDDGYGADESLGITPKTRRDIWRGLVAVDILTKLTLQVRPYEVDAGQTDLVYRETLEGVVERVERDSRSLFGYMREVRERFASVKISGEPRPVVGVVGEIYMRSHRFGNQNVLRQIEELGGEANLTPIAEWMLYCVNRHIEKSRREKRYFDQLKGRMQDWIQRSDERKLYASFDGFLRAGEDAPISELLDAASPYTHHTFEGEAILSIGKAVEYARHGLSGVVNVIPFSCMPGAVVTALSDKVRSDHGDLPWLNLDFDASEETSTRAKLEAFMYQVKERARALESVRM